jgi:hypothetical protein
MHHGSSTTHTRSRTGSDFPRLGIGGLSGRILARHNDRSLHHSVRARGRASNRTSRFGPEKRAAPQPSLKPHLRHFGSFARVNRDVPLTSGRYFLLYVNHPSGADDQPFGRPPIASLCRPIRSDIRREPTTATFEEAAINPPPVD